MNEILGVKGESVNTGNNALILTRAYKWFLNILIAGLPMFGVFYLFSFQGSQLRFVAYSFHEIAITSSILAGGFVTYITWRCYLSSGEIFLRWIAAGLLGFTLVYAPHGFLTRFADQNMWLFLLYGPASRLVMSGCFFLGLLKYGKPANSSEERVKKAFWWKCIALFIVVDCAVAFIASTPVAGHPVVRMSMEISALALSLLSILVILVRQIRSPLMLIYAIALACFAQSSIAFLGALVWTHLWWYAHVIFVAGFFLLSYGIVQAFHTTRSFISVYGLEDMVNKLRDEKARAEDALRQAEASNQQNKILIAELKESIAEVKTLSDLLPICSSCKKIRDDEGYWNGIELYFLKHTNTKFSHGICPDCIETFYGPEMAKRVKDKEMDIQD